MSAPRRSAVPTVVATLLASALVHLLLWPAASSVLSMDWGGAELPIGSGGAMDVMLVPMEGAQERAPEDEPDPKEPAPEERRPDGKLVHLDWLEQEQVPEDADFLSEFDSRVERQTRAPSGRPTAQATPATERGERPDATNSPRQPQADPARALPLHPARRSPADGQGEGAPTAPAGSADDGRLARKEGGGQVSPAGIPGLRGSPSAMRRALGRPGTYDDLRGIDPGEQTLLNSRRWRFASFFNRVRDAVAQRWHPEVLHAQRDPDGRIYGMQTRVTRLVIVLDPDGSLSRVRLDTPSGADYLDEEAIRAVRAAAPFNNPPSQLVNAATGKIEFGFGFIFELRGGRRIFRYRR